MRSDMLLLFRETPTNKCSRSSRAGGVSGSARAANNQALNDSFGAWGDRRESFPRFTITTNIGELNANKSPQIFLSFCNGINPSQSNSTTLQRRAWFIVNKLHPLLLYILPAISTSELAIGMLLHAINIIRFPMTIDSVVFSCRQMHEQKSISNDTISTIPGIP